MSICSIAGIADSQTCASWVQAWGSILAILAAVAVAFVQHRQNLKQVRATAAAQNEQAIAAHLALAERMADDFTRIREVIRNQTAEEREPAALRLNRAKTDLVLFDSLPVNALPTYEAIHSARHLSKVLGDAHECLVAIEYQTTSRYHDGDVDAQLEAEYKNSMDFIGAECVLLRMSVKRLSGRGQVIESESSPSA